MEDYDYAAIRKFIEDALSEDEFQRFCFDHFREVRNKFTAGQTYGARVIDLVDYASRYGHIEKLLEKIKEINPYQFERYTSKIASGGSVSSTLPTPSRQTPTSGNVTADDVQGLIQAGQIGSVNVHYHSNGTANTGISSTSDTETEQNTKDDSDKEIQGIFKAEIDDYCEKAVSLHEKIPLAGFKTPLRVTIKIEDIYVPLRAMLDSRSVGEACFADAEDAEAHLRNHGCRDEISVLEAFSVASRNNRRGIVILGDPGSGKTTHLKRLLLWCLKGGLSKISLPEGIVPVFLPLRELKDLDKGLDSFIQSQLDQPHLGTPEGFGERLLKRGNLLLLLDGLDEVVDADRRSRVSRWIDDAEKIYKSCHFAVTCRFAGYTDDARLNEDFLEMHMRPLSPEQAEAFVKNWYRIVETNKPGLSEDLTQAGIIAEERAGDLIERLKQQEFRARRVFELTRNPLLLTNICLVHHARGNLPHNRADLYDECTDVLLELWRGSIGLEPKVTAKTGRRVLQPAALWLHKEEGRTRATAKELTPIIDPVLKDVGWPFDSTVEFLKAVRDESGLLTGWNQVQYGFIHLGFQEYLAAREILRRSDTDPELLKELAGHFGKSWWQEVMLLLLSLGDLPLFTPFMREVLKQPAVADHPEIIEMCLDDAFETSPLPFVEFLKQPPGRYRNFWKRQLVALRILERLDKTAIDGLGSNLEIHPFDQIRNLLMSRKYEERQEVVFSKPSGYELVRIPGGVFQMGTREEDIPKLTEKFSGGERYYKWETPRHEVRVPDFYMGRYPVTNEEYGRFLAVNKDVKEPEFWGDRKYSQPKQPVVGVSWHDAKKFAEWASLRLPSEAQWEYACRAGATTEFYTGDNEQDLERAGWYEINSDSQLHPVGEKEPNAFGLYDMHGNVFEWCEDDFHESYKGSPGDGSSWLDSPRIADRVIRGGCWKGAARHCRSGLRGREVPNYRDHILGFRLVCLPGQALKDLNKRK